MWERYSERARRAVYFAQTEAQRRNAPSVTSEHLLLGILRDPNCFASKAVSLQGVAGWSVFGELAGALETYATPSPPDLVLSPDAKRAVDLAAQQARWIGNNYIGTEHLLLGVLMEGQSLASRTLRARGMEPKKTRDAFVPLQKAEGRIGGKDVFGVDRPADHPIAWFLTSMDVMRSVPEALALWRKQRVLLTLAVVAVVGVLFAQGPSVWAPFVCDLVFFILALFSGVLVHELAHLFAGLILRFRPIGVKVVWFRWVCKKAPLTGAMRALGWVYFSTKQAQDRPLSWSIVFLAGPVASLTAALGSFAMLWQTSELWQHWFCISATINAILFAMAFSGPRSDFARLVDVWKPNSDTFTGLAATRLSNAQKTARPAEWSPADIERCLGSHDSWYRFMGSLFKFYRSLDLKASDCVALAAAYREASRSDVRARSFEQDAVLESAFCALYFENDVPQAVRFLESLTCVDEGNWNTAIRVDALLRLKRGMPDEAARLLKIAGQLVEKQMQPGVTRDFTVRLLEDVERLLPEPAAL